MFVSGDVVEYYAVDGSLFVGDSLLIALGLMELKPFFCHDVSSSILLTCFCYRIAEYQPCN